MSIVVIFVGIGLSIFSTAIMSYIAMATPIGPWIAPTLVLFSSFIFKIISIKKDCYNKYIALATSAGSVGGILATACAFSYPTIYFLDKSTYLAWMASPIYFIGVLCGLAISAGFFGLWIADQIQVPLIDKQKLNFPIGQLLYKMISSQQELKKSKNLFVGLASGVVYGIFQDGFIFFRGFLPKTLVLLGKVRLAIFCLSPIRLTLTIMPMLWAIGFVTGHVIAIPLGVGALSKILILDPINSAFFSHIKPFDFILAFCSGMVVSGAISGFISTPKALYKTISKMFSSKKDTGKKINFSLSTNSIIQGALVFVLIFSFLTYFKFPFLSQIYLIIFTAICAYQIAIISGKIGLAQLGRFATFVMVPAMFIFKLDFVQLVLISTFVEIAGGVATDALFSRKLAQLLKIKISTVKRYQVVGLLTSAIFIGVVFWLITSFFQLGSPELFAQRAQARRLLINCGSFDLYVLAIGFVFGYILKFIKVSPMLVLGGLLMPMDISIGLIAGGMSTLLFKNKEKIYPFASGLFAANSLWILGQAALKLLK